MNAGLPGAGIGGLFYLAATLLLPVRSLTRRLRGRSDAVTWRQHTHHLSIAAGIMAGLWTAGWLLGFVVPQEMLHSTTGVATLVATRTAIPLAAFGFGVGTLLVVLLMVELAHRMHRPKPAAPPRRSPG
jgi:hypothetical protein